MNTYDQESGSVGLRGPLGRIGAHSPASSKEEFLGRAIEYIMTAYRDLDGNEEALSYSYMDMKSTCDEILLEYKMFLEKTMRGKVEENNHYCPIKRIEEIK